MFALRMLVMALALALPVAGCNESTSNPQPVNLLPSEGDGGSLDNTRPGQPSQKILFVGDSFTYGRYDPAKSFNAYNGSSAQNQDLLVHDLTQLFQYTPKPGTDPRNLTTKLPAEGHPWGGVPGIFQALAASVGMSYDVSISAWPATTLRDHYTDKDDNNPAGGGANLYTNLLSQKWNIVVLQEQSDEPISHYDSFSTYFNKISTDLAANSSDVSDFKIFLYQTWAKPKSTVDPSLVPPGFNGALLPSITNSLNNAFGKAIKSLLSPPSSFPAGIPVSGIPVGDAFLSVYNAFTNAQYTDPTTGATVPVNGGTPINLLTCLVVYGSTSSPVKPCTSFGLWFSDEEHASPQGSYLAALVIFARITGVRPACPADNTGAGSTCLGDSDVAVYTAMNLDKTNADLLKAVADATVFPKTPPSNSN